MTTLALTRSLGLKNSATTYVVLASNKLKPKPMIALESDDHGHDDAHTALPNAFKPSTPNALKNLLIGGNLKVVSPFTSIYKQTIFCFVFTKKKCTLTMKTSKQKGSASYRYSHTDLKVPDFSDYRSSFSEDPVQRTKDNRDDRKTFSYISTFGTQCLILFLFLLLANVNGSSI